MKRGSHREDDASTKPIEFLRVELSKKKYRDSEKLCMSNSQISFSGRITPGRGMAFGNVVGAAKVLRHEVYACRFVSHT